MAAMGRKQTEADGPLTANIGRRPREVGDAPLAVTARELRLGGKLTS